MERSTDGLGAIQVLTLSAGHQCLELRDGESHRNDLRRLRTTRRSSSEPLAQRLDVIAGLGLSNPRVDLFLRDLSAMHHSRHDSIVIRNQLKRKPGTQPPDTSATAAPRAPITSSAATVTPTPWAPPPMETVRPTIASSAITGHAVVAPNGVIVPRS